MSVTCFCQNPPRIKNYSMLLTPLNSPFQSNKWAAAHLTPLYYMGTAWCYHDNHWEWILGGTQLLYSGTAIYSMFRPRAPADLWTSRRVIDTTRMLLTGYKDKCVCASNQKLMLSIWHLRQLWISCRVYVCHLSQCLNFSVNLICL